MRYISICSRFSRSRIPLLKPYLGSDCKTKSLCKDRGLYIWLGNRNVGVITGVSLGTRVVGSLEE